MSDKVTYSELVDAFAEQQGITKTEADQFIKAFRDQLFESLGDERKVSISGLGVFELKWVEERIGRNPRANEAITIEAHNRISYRMDSKMEKLMNKPYEHLTYTVHDDEIESSAPEPTPKAEDDQVPEQPAPPTAPKPAPAPPLVAKEPEMNADFTSEPAIKADSPEKSSASTSNEAAEDKQETQEKISSKSVDGGFSPVWIAAALVVIVAIVVTVAVLSEQKKLPAQTETQPPAAAAQMDQQRSFESEAEIIETEPEEVVYQAVHESKPNEWLFAIARQYYGSPRYWPLIYVANKDKFNTPDILEPGLRLFIPEFNASEILTPEQNKRLANAYFEVYMAFSGQDNVKARAYLKTADDLFPEGVLNSDRRLELSVADAAYLKLYQ